VFTWGDDDAVRFWDAIRGTELFAIHHKDHMSNATPSADGLRLLTSAASGARLWDLSVNDSITSTQRILALEVKSATATDGTDDYRVLTNDEWQEKRRQYQALR
jgi:hypothetical protein